MLNEHGEIGFIAVMPSESEASFQLMADGLQRKQPEPPLFIVADNGCSCYKEGDPANKGAGVWCTYDTHTTYMCTDYTYTLHPPIVQAS